MGTTYLVRKNELSSFADYVAGLGGYNEYLDFVEGAPFLLSRGRSPTDTDTRFQMPVYPVGYDRFSKMPVRGRVERILSSRTTVDRDSDTHDNLALTLRVIVENPALLKKGMGLLAVGSNQHLLAEKFTVTSVMGKVAIVRYSRQTVKKGCVPTAEWDCKDLEHVNIEKGLLLSTNGY